MPTYEYECQKCKDVFEVFQSMKDEPVKTCPKCRGKVKRLLGRGAGIIFKGTGFYETDYKKKTAPASESSSKSSGGESTSATSTKDSSSGTKSTAASATSKTE